MHPELFQIFGFPIGTYGLMMAIAMLSGTTVGMMRARKEGVDPQVLMDIVVYSIIGGVVCGRLGYILVDLTSDHPYFYKDPMSFIFNRTGFVFLYGLLGAIATGVFFNRRAGLNPWITGDIMFSCLPLAHGFGRIGCFFAGCCHGSIIPENSPFAFLGIQFPQGTEKLPSMAFYEHLQSGLISRSAETSLPVWPTQPMEAIGNFLIFIVLSLLWKHRRFNGQIILLYLFLYSTLRFSLEFLRGDADRGYFGPLSTSQWITLFAFISGILLWRRLSTRQIRKAEKHPGQKAKKA